VCICVYLCVFVCICVYLCVFVCICVYLCVFVCICVYLCALVCICVYLCVFVCICVCLCVFVCCRGGSGLLQTIKYVSSVAVLSISRRTAPNIGGAQNPTGGPLGAVPGTGR